MKIIDINQLNPGGPGPGPGAGSPDFLARISQTIQQFKELVIVVQQVRGGIAPDPGKDGQKDQGPGPGPGPGPGDLKSAAIGVLDLVIARGLSNTTVAVVLEKLGPCTMAQIREIIKNA